MRSHASLSLLFSLLSLAAIGCHASAEDSSDVGADRLTTTAKKGGEFVRCSSTSDGNADEFFRVYTVSCRASSAGLGALTGSRIDIDVKSGKGTVQSQPLDGSLDKDVVIGRVAKSDFPLDVHLYGSWSPDGTARTSGFSTHLSLAETATSDAPLVVDMPFDTWSLKFINHLKTAIVQVAPYAVEAAPFVTSTDSDGTTHTTFQNSGESTGASSDPVLTLDVPAPKSGSIMLFAQGASAVARLQIDAPGTYVLDTQGIHLASTEEEGGGSSAPPAPSVDSGASAPPSTCGNAKQAPCESGGNRSCNAGTRFDEYQSLCIACGAAGQTYCVTDASGMTGARRCNDGTRYEDFQSKCIACGAAGQTYCFSDPTNASGSRECNPGLTYDDFTSSCR